MSNLGDPPRVAETLAAARAAVADTAYPLALPGAPDARAARKALLHQLDDYLVPRLARLDAPLLVVVTGSTGVGKSTLVNTLVEAPVTAAGVLRPTTRTPVLVSHPTDAPWFRRPHVLPGLARSTGVTPVRDRLHLVSAHALMPGLALLDTPDVDSVLVGNRTLADQLLAAADLWLFVTTAARYADAVPWRLLTTARDRGTALALVLDRVPPAATAEVGGHLAELAAAHALVDAPLFVVPETVVDGQGLLPERAIAPLRSWLGRLARDPAAREVTVRRTVAGALAAAAGTARRLAAAAEEQADAARDLTGQVRGAYQAAYTTVAEAVAGGTCLHGEALTRWREFVETDELLTALRAHSGRLSNQIVTAVTGRRTPGPKLTAALRSSLTALISWAATDAAERAGSRWRAHPAGEALLAAAAAGTPPGPAEAVDLERPSSDPFRAELLVREWQRNLLRLVRAAWPDSRKSTYAVHATRLLVMLGALGVVPNGPAEPPMSPPDAPRRPVRRLLRAAFAEQTVADLVARAREDLLARVRRLLDDEERRYLEVLAAVAVPEGPADGLWRAAEALSLAAAAAAPAAPEPGEVPATDPEAGQPEPATEPEAGQPEPATESEAGQPEPAATPLPVPTQRRARRKARRRAS